jgi:hypothetical protein
MKVGNIISSVAAGAAVILSVWLLFLNTSFQKLQGQAQQQQQELQAQQQQAQLQYQQVQAQQERINAGTQLAQQVGPAVLKDLGTVAVQNKNDKIKKLLGKYGLTVNEGGAAAATPKPATP